MEMAHPENPERNSHQPVVVAIGTWCIFIVLNVLLHGTIPFALGRDLRPWIASVPHDVLYHLIIYALLFLVTPVVLVKGWNVVKQPGFLFPLLCAVVAITLRPFVSYTPALVVLVVAYLHWKFDLSGLGIRSSGWRGDLAAIVLIGLIVMVPVLLQPPPHSLSPGRGLLAGLERWFSNPASSVENLFYFGFLAERLSYKFGRWLTPFIIGLMYTIHEMCNPEYWYELMQFPLVFVGVTLLTVIYLWRGSVAVIWLGDGLGRALRGSF